MVGDERTVKVHVHVNDPGVVLTEALKHGAIGDVEINDMHAQTRERDERLAPAPEVGEGGTVVVAVVAGAGNQQLFRDLGCHAIVDGGQSMNPSAAQLLEAVEELGVEEVVILPNNGNVILTAEQAAGMSSLHIAVVPSTLHPQRARRHGRLRPRARTPSATPALMQDAIVDVRYAEVTHAVRDSELDGLEVKKGQAMAIVDGRLVAASDDLESAFGGVLEEFARGGAEYVTVLTALNGCGHDARAARRAGRARRARRRSQLPRGRPAALPDPGERRVMTDLLTLENTAIVLDSTCDPPDGCLDQPGLYMVPLKVHFGDQMFRDGVDMTYKEFFAKLEQSEILPTTSQPTAGEFVATYEEARKHYEHVFSLHLSGEMSGTVRAAEQAAEQFDNVYVYDLRTVTTALSLGAERLRARLAQGCTLDEAHAYVGTSATTRTCSSTPRPSSTCVAAAASAGPPRWSAASSTSSR